MVEWRTITDFPDYAVSDEGGVKRIKPDRYGRLGPGQLSPAQRPDGYLSVSLHRDAKQSVRLVHRLVCEAFCGSAPGVGFHASHGDGDRANNRADNLRWATVSENNLDKHFHGTIRTGDDHHARARPSCMPRGVSHGNAKLDDASVALIRKDTRPQRLIAAQYGVSQSLISMVKSAKGWTHI